MVVILFLIGSWVPRNYQMLLETPFPVYVAAIGIGLTGMLLGYWLAAPCVRTPTARAPSAWKPASRTGRWQP